MEAAPRPEWMNDNFLSTCITNSNDLPKDSSIDISDVKLYYAVPKGENYLSIIYRVNVEYHVVDGAKSNGIQNGGLKTDSLIVKSSHESEQMKHIGKVMGIFQRETDMYLKVMPNITDILESAGIDTNIVCKCVHSLEGDKDVLVMEDLKLKGYLLADRLKGLDLAHAKLVFDKLAKLHAGSMHYYSTNEIPEMYHSSPFGKQKKDDNNKAAIAFENSLHEKCRMFIEKFKNNPKYHNRIINFFEKYDEVVMDVLKIIYNRVPGSKFNAMLHGDCWLNNMMFKYSEDGSVKDVVFVDLQISFNATVGIDFLYFFFTSANKEVRKHHFTDLKKFYIDSLRSYLKKLDYAGDIPTLEEFEDEIKRVIVVAINSIIITNAIVLAEYKEEKKSRSESAAFEMEDVVKFDSASTIYIDTFFMSIDLLEENGYINIHNLPDVSTDSTVLEK